MEIDRFLKGFFSTMINLNMWLAGGLPQTDEWHDKDTGMKIYPRNFIGPIPANSRYQTWWEAYGSHTIVIGLVIAAIWFFGKRKMVSDLI